MCQMKRYVIGTVLMLFVATAGATISMQTTYNGQFPIQSGAAFVDSWTVSFTSDSDLIAGFSAELSDPAYQIGAPANPPLQPNAFLTPTLTEARDWDRGSPWGCRCSPTPPDGEQAGRRQRHFVRGS